MNMHEAAEKVLKTLNRPATIDEIYNLIIQESLFEFNPKKETPQNVLKKIIERKCINSNLTYKTKDLLFYKEKKQYGLIEWLDDETYAELFDQSLENTIESHDDSIRKIVEDLSNIKHNQQNSQTINELVIQLKQEINFLKTDQNLLQEKKEKIENEFHRLYEQADTRVDELYEKNKQEFLEKINELTISLETDSEEIKRIKEEAAQTLQMTQEVGMSTFYSQKEQDILKEKRFYFWFFFGSIISALSISLLILAIEYGLIFEKIQTQNLLAIKITVYLPIILLASFMWRNYSQAQRLFEEYAHKAILAKNIAINRLILKNDAGLDNNQIAEHATLKSIEHILANPMNSSKNDSESQPLESLINTLIKKIDGITKIGEEK